VPPPCTTVGSAGCFFCHLRGSFLGLLGDIHDFSTKLNRSLFQHLAPIPSAYELRCWVVVQVQGMSSACAQFKQQLSISAHGLPQVSVSSIQQEGWSKLQER
jgi:hypothetical protein